MKVCRTFLLAALVAVGLVASAPAQAQDTMTFGKDDKSEGQQEDGQEGDGEQADGDQADGEQGDGEQGAQQSDKPLVAILAVPNDTVDESQRNELEKEVRKVLKLRDDIRIGKSKEAVEALKNEGAVDSWVKEQLCMGAVGDKIGADFILVARIRPDVGKQQDEGDGGGGADEYALDLDYFEVEDRLFSDVRSAEGRGSVSAALSEVEPKLKDMFDLTEREKPNYGGGSTGVATTVVAISSAVLSAGGIAGGIIFGLQAQSIEEELEGNSADNGECGCLYPKDFTQQQAQSRLQEAESKALTANIFYGLAGVFGITSAVLFLVNPGSDAAGEAQADAGRLAPTLDLAPVFRPTGAGIQAEIRF